MILPPLQIIQTPKLNLTNSIFKTIKMDRRLCQVCDRQALYLCGDCKNMAYCTNEHRTEHWRIHKDQCKIMQIYSEAKNQKQVEARRLLYRKQYFDTFSNKIYDRALKIAKQMLAFQKQHIQSTRFIQNEFQYGITVCLVCRTLILLGKMSQAKIQITEYLKQKQHFLQDMRDICKFPQDTKKQQKPSKQIRKQPDVPVTQKTKQFLRKKLQLISAVANIFHSLSLPPIQFYIIYLNHIEFTFGADSLEASNCYFMMGTYYMQQNQYNRAIACFVRAADIRGPKGGDCFYNLAVIYEMRSKLDVAVRMYELAIKLYEQEQGDSSKEVAKVNEDIAQILIKKNDWNGAIKAFEKALKIYAIKHELDQFQLIKQKIKALHQYIKKIIESKDKVLLPKEIQDQLIDKKNKQNNQNQNKAEDLSFAQQAKRIKERFQIQNLLRLSQSFLSKLNPLEIYRLSQLQLQLETCNSEFALAYTVANSDFLQRLGDKRLKEMKEENERLFELMNLERKASLSVVEDRLA